MSYKEHIIGKPLYNPVSTVPSVGGMKQYKVSSTNELAGVSLAAYLDGAEPLFIQFADGENLTWATPGQPMRWETYEAAKADENLFIIKFMQSEKTPKTNVTLVWDRESTLVTCVVGVLGRDEKHPRLVESKVFFGAQKLPHTPLATARHGYTKDLVGKRIIWRYNPNDEIMHCYCGENYFRLGTSEKVLSPDATPDQIARYKAFQERKKVYPVYEEPAYYIKIKEGFYLYSVTEKNLNRFMPKMGGNQLLIVLNALRVRYIGRVFGYRGDGSLENDFIGAIGSFCPEPDALESLPYPQYPEEK